MNKPVKPKKPSNEPPVDFKTKELIVFENFDEDIVLGDYSYIYNKKDNGSYKYASLNLNICVGLSYRKIQKIKEILDKDIQDFVIGSSYNVDGYFEYFFIKFDIKKDLKLFQQEIKEFNNRFTKYEKDLEIYRQQVEEYGKLEVYKRIERLNLELEKLKKN